MSSLDGRVGRKGLKDRRIELEEQLQIEGSELVTRSSNFQDGCSLENPIEILSKKLR